MNDYLIRTQRSDGSWRTITTFKQCRPREARNLAAAASLYYTVIELALVSGRGGSMIFRDGSRQGLGSYLR